MYVSNVTVKAFFLSTLHITNSPKPCAAVRTTDMSHQDDMTLVTTVRMIDESGHEIKSDLVYFLNACCWCYVLFFVFNFNEKLNR